MDVEKDAFNPCDLPRPEYTQDNTTNTLMPPPYMDDPPAYSTVVENSSPEYYSFQTMPDYMSKLPFGQSSNSSSHSSTAPPEVQVYSQQFFNPQAANQHLSRQQVIVQHSTDSTFVTPQFSQQTTIQKPDNPPVVTQLNSNTAALHKVLLQPTSSRIVETTAVGRRKKKSHVTDLATGKEYIVKEKTSRSGKRSKAVIKEIGGPKTYVKETPTKTLICQKKL